MRTKLSQVHMKAGEDPRVLFNQLATFQSAYNNTTRKTDPDDLKGAGKVQINSDGRSNGTRERA
jgi:hypothetical protein